MEKPGGWTWLFPATYLLHIAEELWGGEGFPAWVSRVAGFSVAPEIFLMINGGFWIAMIAAVLAARRSRSAEWTLATLGTVTLVNGLLHLAGTAVTGSYPPGLYTGLLLWVPLGAFALRWASGRLAAGAFRLACLGGLGLQALASLVLFGMGR